MKSFVEEIVKKIVDRPEAVNVRENSSEAGVADLQIIVDRQDMGKVIGKEGKIIKAIRDLCRLLAVKENRKVNVSLVEA